MAKTRRHRCRPDYFVTADSSLWLLAVAFLFLAGTSADSGVEFSAIGSYRLACDTSNSCWTVPVVNLGHCCMLCAADDSCAVVTYISTTQSCQLATSVYNNVASHPSGKESVTLLKIGVLNNTEASSVVAQMQPVVGVHMLSGSAEVPTSYVSQKAITIGHCWSICIVLTGSFCRLFAFHAIQLTCEVYDVDFYSTWTTISSSDSNWISYYASQTNGFKLLYKISKGIGVDASNALILGPSNITATRVEMAMDGNCACHLRNDIIDSWSHFPITMVSVVLVKSGSPPRYVNLTTNAADNVTTFFSASKIAASSWTDLTSSSQLFTMELGKPPGSPRYFAIFKDPAYICAQGNGWISVNGRTTSPTLCDYDGLPVPQFTYADGPTFTYFQYNGTHADALLIYAKM